VLNTFFIGPNVSVHVRILFPQIYKTTDKLRIPYIIATISPNAFFTPSTLIQSAIHSEKMHLNAFLTTKIITNTSPEIYV
jgi:hypothetical protein